ncbi:AAEL004646-PA [Aedes aegypti]|uniref:AAEL004646-PA n=1 Tax=Aedes aegypti TaxID=7159 RepID=Q17C85_AEDAE|nr:AAEL004646-PA [Aedes aegypti]
MLDPALGTAVVIDNGSGWIKAGLAGEDEPSAVFPTFVAENDEGHRNPVRLGTIIDWDGMEKVWQATFRDRLNVAPEEHPVLLTDVPLNPKAYREKMTQIMFESFNCPAVYMANQAVLSLYAAGRTSGIVLDCGHDVTHIVPVYRGHALSNAIKRLVFAGRSLTDYLADLLEEKGTPSLELETVRGIKEKLGYVAFEFDKEMSTATTEKYFQLPNGKSITVGQERFRCAEALFQPALLDLESPGVHQVLFDSLMQCDIDVRKELFGNVVLSGGSTMFGGMRERLELELRALAPGTVKVKVVAPAQRVYSAWRGGSNLASLASCQKLWITREEYDEFGLDVVQRKCL